MNLAEIRRELTEFKSKTARRRHEIYGGLPETSSFEEIRETGSEIFSQSAIELLKGLTDNPAGQSSKEIAARHKLTGIILFGFLSRKTAEIDSQIERARRKVSIKINGELLNGPQIRQRILAEEEKDARRQIDELALEASSVFSDLIFEKLGVLKSQSQKFANRSISEMFESSSNIRSSEFQARAAKFLEITEEIYMKMFSDRFRSTNCLTHSDFQYYLENRDRRSPFLGKHLKYFYVQILESFGFSERKVPQIKFMLENPEKISEKFAIRIPEEIFFHCSAKDGTAGYLDFFRIFGESQQNAWTSRNLIEKYPEFVFSTDNVLANGFGVLFQTLLIDELFLKKILLIEDQNLLNSVLGQNKFRFLYEIRREIIKSGLENSLYFEESADLDKLFNDSARSFSNALNVEFRSVQLIHDISFENAAQKRVRGFLFGVGLREYLRQRHGFDWWKKRTAFMELIDLWNTAETHSAEEMASLIGFEMSFEQLAISAF